MIYRLPSFDRTLARLNPEQQSAVRAAVREIPGAFGRPHHHAGIGLRPFGSYFECRAGLGLRVLFLAERGDFFLVMVGNHDQVRSYLKNNG